MILKRIKIYSGLCADTTNCYMVQDEETKEAIVLDPGGEAKKIIEMLEILEAKVKYIYLTHCHGDHIGAAEEIRKSQGGKVLIHRFDAEGLENPAISLVDYIGMRPISLEADSRVDDKDLMHRGNLEFQVLHTPGHTKGGSSLYNKQYNLLFSGDTIFRGTWGRTDLPTSNFQDIINSITNEILVLPEETIIYPGHGKSTMVKEEKPIYLQLKPSEM